MAESDNNAPDCNEQVVQGSGSEEAHAIDATDDYDPFADAADLIEECETVECSSCAPPENQWYHGKLDRTTAEERLKNSEVGGYLVRESDRRPGSYVLSFLSRNGINHFRITAMCGDYYIGGREFDTLSDLIGYYTSYADLLKSERLLYPVPPPEPVNDRRRVIALLPYQKMPDTDELSFQKGEVFVVHNDMGDGWLWVTSQYSNLSGIINQELVKQYECEDFVEMEEWFHADITKEEARQKLANAGVGSWLVRPSDSALGDYTLYFHVNKHIERFRIQRFGSHQQFVMGGRTFDSVAAIIERYKQEQIVEGSKLGLPVLRPKLLMVPKDDVDGRANSDIYAAVKQSNGSNFFLNRKDNIVLKGYLNKKSQKTKKWKSMYFVLNDTEQQLYYFENQKRSKPKGLIDLSYSSLYPVDDSLFGRPNCFQVIMRALNNVSVYYMCAENSDKAQEWVQALKRYCLNTQPKRSKNLTDVPTEVRSLYIKIFEAKRIPAKQLPHPYCIIALNDMKLCRTQAKDAPDPCWDEEFLIDDIPPDITTFSISIYNKTKRKDIEVMNMKKTLDTVRPEFEEDWCSLWPVNFNTKSSELPSVRVRTRFRVEIILPTTQYTSLMELLLSNLELLFVLANVCSASNNDRTLLATAVLNIFRNDRQEALLLRTANEREIEREENSCTLFRGVSFATTLMDQYMRMMSTEFVNQAVGGVINKIVDSKQTCDLSLQPSDGITSEQQDANLRYLMCLMDEMLDSIFLAADTCPIVLRYICGCLQKKVGIKWPTEPLIKTRAVSGFIFLRLLCLAIYNPKQFNLVTEAPSQMAARTLKLVANTLIKLANLTEYKEPVMEQMNGFIKDRHQQLVDFLDKLSNVNEMPTINERPAIDVGRSLAIVHQLSQSHIDELKKISQTKPDTKKLVVITETLTTHEKMFMTTTQS